MKIDVVSSCWRYPRALVFHLSAMLGASSDGDRLRSVVYFAEEDTDVLTVIRYFCELQERLGREFLVPVPFSRPRLMRRAIARNHYCEGSDADLVVFTDVDYLYPGGVLAAIGRECVERGLSRHIFFTPNVRQSIDHEQGDLDLRRVVLSALWPMVPTGAYEIKRLDRAIGGSQIVSGEVARSHGYVPRSKWQQPADVWQRTFEDVAYRKSLQEVGVTQCPLDAVGVWRIRHSQRGREQIGCQN